MRPLSDRQRVLLKALPRQQRIARVLGIACSLLGILYIVWAVGRFEPKGNPAEQIGFDAPVTKSVATLFLKYSDYLGKKTYEDHQARALAAGLRRNMDFSAGLLLLAFRVILGLVVAMLGFATLTVVIERARLLRILEARGVMSNAGIHALDAPSAAPLPPTE